MRSSNIYLAIINPENNCRVQRRRSSVSQNVNYYHLHHHQSVTINKIYRVFFLYRFRLNRIYKSPNQTILKMKKKCYNPNPIKKKTPLIYKSTPIDTYLDTVSHSVIYFLFIPTQPLELYYLRTPNIYITSFPCMHGDFVAIYLIN